MRHAAAAAAVLALCVSSAALAQAPGDTPPHPVDAPQKDPAVAVEISVGATVAGFGLAIAGAKSHSGALGLLGFGGMYLGPSAGSWYSGRVGGLGIAGRTAAALIVAYGIGMMDSSDYDCDFVTAAECSRIAADAHAEAQRGEIVFYSGFAVWGIATLYDFYAAHGAAKAWNREHHVTLAPMVASTGHGRATGVALAFSF